MFAAMLMHNWRMSHYLAYQISNWYKHFGSYPYTNTDLLNLSSVSPILRNLVIDGGMAASAWSWTVWLTNMARSPPMY